MQELLDNDPMTRLSEHIATEHVFHSPNGLCLGLSEDDSLPGRQSVGLDHQRCTLFTNIGDGIRNTGKRGVGCARNMMTGHEIPGKGLGAFQLRRTLCWPETLQPGIIKPVNHTGYQWSLGANDRQADLFILSKGNQRIRVIGTDGDIFNPRFQGGTGISRRHEHRIRLR